MSTASYREQHPPNLATSVDADYDYRAGARPTPQPTPTPTSASARGMTEVESYNERTSAKYDGGTNGGNHESTAADGEEALLDLVQLEELHQEAEKMKALGNKHMASQEFTRAYNAYSAALQLSPVGPSSHVFLSNRAAALLSLKRYAAAATDAKRAVALAPTFGKAHARLGQALYFQKNYAGAVKAYEDAIEYEPDNNVTKTYLEKAKAKLEKQNRRARGEEVSVADTTQFTAPASVVTDVNRSHGVVQSGGYRGSSDAVVQAVARKPAPNSTQMNGLPPTPPSLHPASTPSSQMSSPLHTLSDLDMDEDPDFEEALKIQIRANRFLANKQYKFAIEEYTAALFLVPDDKQLSPDLHLGRAHALNGSRRHESARNDAMLAIRLNPTPAAYSTLAKSLFYMKDYQGAVKAFQSCIDALPEGESLGMFDQAYLQKAEAALEEQSASLSLDNRSRASTKASTPVPKLPPPRFVPREEAMQQTHNLPSMPKQWPQQIPSSPTALRCGPERDIIFLSESLGIKLNRGPDGIVRVLSVAPHTAGSPVARDGAIYAGDVVREAAGVDIRRPITNVMWGDTVALIKMAPRPITMVVAKELSEVPPAVIEEQRRAQTPTKPASPANYRSSPANGDESVGQVTTEVGANRTNTEAVVNESEQVIDHAPGNQGDITVHVPEGGSTEGLEVGTPSPDRAELNELLEAELNDVMNALADDISDVDPDNFLTPDKEIEPAQFDGATKNVGSVDGEDHKINAGEAVHGKEITDGASGRDALSTVLAGDETLESPFSPSPDTVGEPTEIKQGVDSNEHPVPLDAVADNQRPHEEEYTNQTGSDLGVIETTETKQSDSSLQQETEKSTSNTGTTDDLIDNESDRVVEARLVGGDIFFDGSPPVYNGWDNLRWMSYSGARKLTLFRPVFRYREMKQKTIFWSKVEREYVPRVLALYEEPSVFLILRRPAGEEELTRLTGSSEPGDERKCWVVESVVEPATCKLQLSHLTHPSSIVAVEDADERSKSLFEIISPAESIRLSAVKTRDGTKKGERSFADSGAFLETSSLENSLVKSICNAHDIERDVTDDNMLRHQVILGTLHAYVLSGSVKALEAALARASEIGEHSTSGEVPKTRSVPSRILNALDDNGRPALYYACRKHMTSAVVALVSAGAETAYRTPNNGMTLIHLCALNLDSRALATLLKSSRPSKPDPNALDSMGRTAMYVAALEGRNAADQTDAEALERCIQVLIGERGQLMIDLPRWIQHPVSKLASSFRTHDLSVILKYVSFRFPLKNSDGLPVENSLASFYDYPLHSAVISFLDHVKSLNEGQASHPIIDLSGTVNTLLDCGFEPNERLDDSKFARSTGLRYVGYTPLQLLGLAALMLEKIGPKLGQRVYGDLDSIISTTAITLIGKGARINLDSPPGQRTKTNGGVDLGEEEESVRTLLKIDTNQPLLRLLGGAELLSQAKKGWTQKGKVEAGPAILIQRDNSMKLENSREPGGNNEKSCAICWKPFGMIVRKHRCRVSWRHVCDECSSKRITRGGEDHRVSDGQFLVAFADTARAASQTNTLEIDRKNEEQASTSRQSIAVPQSWGTATAARMERLEAEEEANRNSLFGGALDQAAKYVFGDEDQTAQTSQGLGGLATTLGETRNALLERGDKLSTLNDKSAQMVDASANFAQMAKELRKKSEQGFLW